MEPKLTRLSAGKNCAEKQLSISRSRIRVEERRFQRRVSRLNKYRLQPLREEVSRRESFRSLVRPPDTRGPRVHSQSLQRWLTGSSYYEDTSPAARRLLSPLIYNRGQCPEPTIESASLPAAALLSSHRSGFKDQNRRRFQDHLFQRVKASSHD